MKPQALDFLRTVTPEHFATDLRRYDRCAGGHRTYREVAYLEALEARQRAGRARAPGPRPRGIKIPKEDAVEESVKRICAAIHRRPFRRGPGYGVETRDQGRRPGDDVG